MVDLTPRCLSTPEEMHPVGQEWCPDYHALVMVEAQLEPAMPSHLQSSEAMALGASAILIPWIWGRAARLVSDMIAKATPE